MEIKLWENEVPYLDLGADTPNSMETYFIDTWHPVPCVVVLPGGGYTTRAPHEGKPIAEFFNSRGMHAVVVNYRVKPNTYPAPLADAQRAIKLLRANAKKWAIDPNKIVSLGFSAGGHLSASLAVLEDVTKDRIHADEIDSMSARPNGSILCYPVISMLEGSGSMGSIRNLLGDKYERRCEYFSLEKRVTDETPPAFLWHTAEDSGINVKNSLAYAAALRDHKIPFEMHIYPHGPHGLGLAHLYDDVSTWADLAADWIIHNI